MNIGVHVGGLKGIGGATISICTAGEGLSKRGHEVRICATSEELGILPQSMQPLLNNQPIEKAYQWADVMLVHWYRVKQSEKLGQNTKRVLFVVDKNHPRLRNLKPPELVVFNSNYTQKEWRYSGRSMVLYPPIYPEVYKTKRGEAILLVGALETKGLRIFLEIAKSMPKHQFVLAQGRCPKPNLKLPGNMELLTRRADARGIYKAARIILMPSENSPRWEEGYGRVAIEAAASGIPCIASKESPALGECLGPDGLFVARKKIQGWVDMIKSLDDPLFYAERSRKALELSASRHPDKQLDELDGKLRELVRK